MADRRCIAELSTYAGHTGRVGSDGRCTRVGTIYLGSGAFVCVKHNTNGYIPYAMMLDQVGDAQRERARRVLEEELLDQPNEMLMRGDQKKLEKTRAGLTLHFTIITKAPKAHPDDPESTVEVDGYVTTGTYEDGRLGEFLIRTSKEMAALGPMMDQWATATSIALQYGAPIDKLLGKFVATRFEPSGPVLGVDGLKKCTSPVDLIARWLLAKYAPKEAA